MNTLEFVKPGNGYKPRFELLAKRKVNGDKEDKLFTWLKSLCPNPTTLIGDPAKLFYSPIRTTDISWNFEKFLIDHRGRPRKRYTPGFQPEDIAEDIEALYDECMKAKRLRNTYKKILNEV